MNEAPLIEIHNATVWRGSTRVFHHFSLTIQQHERVAVLGPNGSGKTTLLKTINRDVYSVAGPDSWIRILGRERWNVWDLRKDIGLVSQDLLGRALVHDPHTLILDEPTAGLDMSASCDFLGRIRDLARRGRSLIWVTHHLNDIPPEIDRVIVLKDGAIVADGPKASVLTAALLSDVYDADLCLTEIDGHYFAYPGAGS